MKKKIRILLLLAASGIMAGPLSAQDISFGNLSKPVPSESSLTTFNTTPISYATGVPDISIPLASLSSNDSRISAGLSLRYHPDNSIEKELAGEAGAGWVLTKGGVITREIASELDESYYDSSSPSYKKNEFDDVYYYNLPTGTNGKFRFVRDIAANTFQIVNLSPNSVKIEFTRDTNTSATLVVNSFTITDTYGYQYIFSDYSQSRFEGKIGTSSISGLVYRSAFYLSSIKSPQNTVLLTYDYQKDSKYRQGTSLLSYQLCKLTKVNSPNTGSVEIQYDFVTELENSMSDPYSLKKVILRNVNNDILSQYRFVYDLPYIYYNEYQQLLQKRILTAVEKLDPNNTLLDKTKISAVQNQLKIENPGGGMVEYNFESNERFQDYNTPQYIDLLEAGMGRPEDWYYQNSYTWDFDTRNASTYTFQVTGTPGKQRVLKFTYNGAGFPPLIPGEDSGFEHIDYRIEGVTQNSGAMQENEVCYSTNVLQLLPGTYTLKILGTGTGSIVIDEMIIKPAPYRNYVLREGLRIKNIRYFSNSTDTQPVKTVALNYDKFNNAISSSSGIRNIYQNVAIRENSGNGYTRYYYTDEGNIAPYDITENGNTITIFPDNDMLENGMLQKQEVYNEQNQVLSSSEYTYLFEKKDLQEKLIKDSRTVPVFTKKITVLNKNYGKNGQPIANSSETEINTDNYQTGKEKETLANGDIVETQTFYASGDNQYTHLQNAHMISVPVKTIMKKNGKLLSTSQVKYDNGSLRPTSTVVTNAKDGSVKTTQRFDAYDSEGNIRQYTTNIDWVSGQGFPSVVIWGYHKTLPLAKISGARLEDIGTLADDIIAKSDLDNSIASEKTLLEALDVFRTHPSMKNFQVTTYTHDPLTGTTSVTAPNGIRENYTYDIRSRLSTVTDVNGNRVSDYKYNTKPQP